MNEIELKERILKGENLHTEFKEPISNNEDIAKCIVSFANTDGGQIIFGVNDNGEVVGVTNIDELLRRTDDIAFNRCEPPVTIVPETLQLEDKSIIIINVPKGSQRPYRTSRGYYYVRSANRCRQASREELLRLFQETESIYYDEIELPRASIKDMDMSYAKEFLDKFFAMRVENSELLRYLINIKAFTKNEKPTLTGMLFFGENPQDYIPYARIVAAYIEGEDISTPPSNKKEFKGKISQILEDCMSFLKIYIKEKHIIKGLEPEGYPEIEDFVLREALVNAVAHRDYTINAPVRVFIFPDRIEFYTPGKLPNTVTVDNMRMGVHVIRNPNIYNFLNKMGLVTDIGSGVRRIISSVQKTVGKDVELKLTDNEFVLIIPRKSD